MAITKAEAAARPESAWNRTQDDEPVFVLCGRDTVAPDAVRLWVEGAKSIGVSGDKLVDALKVADAMDAWQRTHGAKVPDFEEGE